jgi:hypothetical protein
MSELKMHPDVAELIQAAVLTRKDDAERQQPLIRPWRMDAKQDAYFAKGFAECGCGISQDDPQPK